MESLDNDRQDCELREYLAAKRIPTDYEGMYHRLASNVLRYVNSIEDPEQRTTLACELFGSRFVPVRTEWETR